MLRRSSFVLIFLLMYLVVCVCFLFILDSRGHTGFFIHLLSAVRGFVFTAYVIVYYHYHV